LGGSVEDEAVRAAIGDALAAGTLVIAAAGNDGRKPVSFPASVDFCVAVSAMGQTDGFPKDSSEHADVAKPHGSDPTEFFAAFSNFGPQIDFVGPGVGIVSTLPEHTYGVMSGTSMACPAIVGFAAYLLALNPVVKDANGNDRIRRWKALLGGCANPAGFGRDYEGFGLPTVPGSS
jgi:subtilisin